jgi:uncharacterized membrane protein YfcA
MSPLEGALVFIAGAVASAINSVAGGGTLLTFPVLTMPWGAGLPTNVANATNAIGLWPGSLGGVFGFWNLIDKTKHHILPLLAPTIIGSISGAELFVLTPKSTFDFVVPVLILLASTLLMLQKKIKRWVLGEHKTLHPAAGILLQFLVALYGGYFGAGMGIMMLAAFALYMEGTIHEINAIKTLLGVVVNFVASAVFIVHSLLGSDHQSLVNFPIGIVLAIGSLLGGFYSAKLSQKVDPDKLRMVIAAYGVLAACYYAFKALHFA